MYHCLEGLRAEKNSCHNIFSSERSVRDVSNFFSAFKKKQGCHGPLNCILNLEVKKLGLLISDVSHPMVFYVPCSRVSETRVLDVGEHK